jgi:hypothetical protein
MDVFDERRRESGVSAEERLLPILFHLRDVSRPPRPKAPEALPLVSLPVAPIVPPLPPVPPLGSDSASTVEESPSHQATEKSDLPPVPVYLDLAELKPEYPGPTTLAAASLAVEAVHESRADDTSCPQPAAQEVPTPEPAQAGSVLRERKSRQSQREDWFAAHGKFIAAAFVLALIGTIYFARTTHRQAQTRSTAAHSAPPLAEDLVKVEMPPKASENKASDIAHSAAATTETAGSKALASDTAQAELYLPVAPATSAAPPLASSPAGDSLFTSLVKKPEERTASRPVIPGMQMNPHVEAKAADNQARTLSPAAGPSPPVMHDALSPSYPVTSSAPLPRGSSPQVEGYPHTGAPPLAGAPTAGMPTPPSSQETIVRGSRYERTGTGNY